MPLSVSGSRIENSGLVTAAIPAIALAVFGLPTLYVAIAIGPYFLLDWAIAMGSAAIAARVTVARVGFNQRLYSAFIWAGVVPGIVAAIGIIGGIASLAAHGILLFMLCALAWGFIPPFLEQCLGWSPNYGRFPRPRLAGTSKWPFVTVYRPAPGETGTRAFSGDLLGMLLFIGATIFAVGGYLYRTPLGISQGSLVPNPIPFGIAFFMAAACLASLTKLAEQLQATPQARISPSLNLIPTWARTMAAILVILGLCALSLPKAPVIAPVRWLKQRLIHPRPSIWAPPGILNEAPPQGSIPRLPDPRSFRGSGGSGNHPEPSVSLPEGSSSGSNLPSSGSLPGGNWSGGSLPGANGGGNGPGDGNGIGGSGSEGTGGAGSGSQEPSFGGMKGPNANGLGKLPDLGKQTPEGSPSQSGNSSLPKVNGNLPRPGNSPGQREHGDTSQMSRNPDSQQEDTGFQQETKSPAGRKRTPINWRFLLRMLLILALVVALIIFFSSPTGRCLLQKLAKWLGRFRSLSGKASSRISPRISSALLEREIQRQMARTPDPFADPFRIKTNRTAEETACAAYAALLAYLWLLDIERYPAETAMDFGERAGRDAKLNQPALRDFTVLCTHARFSPGVLTQEQLTQLRTNYEKITREITSRLPIEIIMEKKNAYRRELAKRALEEMAGCPNPTVV